MALITIHRRAHGVGEVHASVGLLTTRIGWGLVALASAGTAWLVWHRLGGAPNPGLGIAAFLERGQVLPLPLFGLVAPLVLLIGLRLARVLERRTWVLLWSTLAPWLLLGLTWLIDPPYLVAAWLVPLPCAWLGIWPLVSDRPAGLHRARWATGCDLRPLLVRPEPGTGLPPGEALLLGVHGRDWVAVRSQPTQRELGGLLVAGRPRAGKGLLAKCQLLGGYERRSVMVTDRKGELHAATAGWRSRFGKIIVLDPTGVGHRFDPLAERETEDDLYRAAQDILHVEGEGDGQAFTERAASMLAALFVAAKREGIPCLPYARELIRLGLRAAGERLGRIDPLLCQQLLADQLEDADWESRFLTGSWQTLVSRTWPLLTERVVRTFGGSDFRPADLLGEEPISVYLRLTERDMRGLKPLLRLVWETLLNELVAHYDRVAGEGCHPVLLMLDEATRFAVPSLPEYAATVAGRGLSLWVAVQSLSQFDGVYGRAGALALRDSLDSQLFYRPSELATAEFLEQRLGQVSAYARSYTRARDGSRESKARSERPVPLLVAQEVLQLPAHQVIAFHRDLPPALLDRANWLQQPALRARHGLPVPAVVELPPAPRLPDLDQPPPSDLPVGRGPIGPRHPGAREPEEDGWQPELDFDGIRDHW
jgi:type IV secretion system protein VirD4